MKIFKVNPTLKILSPDLMTSYYKTHIQTVSPVPQHANVIDMPASFDCLIQVVTAAKLKKECYFCFHSELV